MRIFVASWFFPPATSSEGIVTYKLLRNSHHTYDVCSALSNLWGYKSSIPVSANNIKTFPIETNDLDTWVEEAFGIFCREHKENPYDAVMTRCMPPESIEVAKRIKERYPEIPWIASLADPMARSPYHIKSLIEDNDGLREHEKRDFLAALDVGGCKSWGDHRNGEIRYLCQLKEVEDYALDKADVLIFPCDTLKSYMLAGRIRSNVLVVPHSFDKSLYPTKVAKRNKGADSAPITVSFLGHTDDLRSLEPVVRALHFLKQNNPDSLGNIKFRFVGHVTEKVRALIYNYFLYDCIDIETDVDYLASLKIMENSDWLLHVDAYFERHSETGGSIFFAGKLADYMGTQAPILALTGKHSPADIMVQKAGGVSVDPNDIPALAEIIAQISQGKRPDIDSAYREKFDAINVAEIFDASLEKALDGAGHSVGAEWPPAPTAADEKIMTVCIPAYNVQQYLARCLHSLISCKTSGAFQLVIVNDGSKDATLRIARDFEKHYPGIVEVIDKENGGHGSTINAALAVAKGEYFRVIDGDDWVDSINLDKTISRLLENNIHADVISSNYDQIYIEEGNLVPWTKKGEFEDYKEYDFASTDFSNEYFTMAASMFKTDVLRQADFKIQEHTFYVDVEYLLFPIPFCKTVAFTPECIYRYAVGNANQSINPETFTKKYDHHDRVIRRMLSYYVEKKSGMGQGQRDYMRSLFTRHLLPSHFLLSLAWDIDRKRGCERAKAFDEFLRATDPDLYKQCGKHLKAVKKARRKGYDPRRFKKPITIEDRSSTSRTARLKEGIVETLYTTNFGHRLAENKLLYALYEKHFKKPKD